MKNEAENLEFMAIDSTSGTPNPIKSTLALVNNSDSNDEEVRKSISECLKETRIDFYSPFPRELPALHEIGEDGKKEYFIYSPREGEIKIDETGREDQWQKFVSGDINVYLRRAA